MSELRTVSLTAYLRRQDAPGFEAVPVQVRVAVDNPFTEDVVVVLAGSQTPQPWFVDALHSLGDSVDIGLLAGPADHWDAQKDDNRAWERGSA